MASDQKHEVDNPDVAPVDVPEKIPAGLSDDAWVDVDGKRMRLSALVAEHREMRGRSRG
jgi:hypothetical protein